MLVLSILSQLVPVLAISDVAQEVTIAPLNLNSAVGEQEQAEVAAHNNFAKWRGATHSTIQDGLSMQQEQLNEVSEAISSYTETAKWLRKGTLKNMSGLNVSLHLMQTESQLWRSRQMKAVIEMQVKTSKRLLGVIDNATAWEDDAFAAHKRAWAQLHIEQDAFQKVQLVQQSEPRIIPGEQPAELPPRFSVPGPVPHPDEKVRPAMVKSDTVIKPSRVPSIAIGGGTHGLQPPPGLLMQLPRSRTSTDLANQTLTPLLTLAGVNTTQALQPVSQSVLTELSTQMGSKINAAVMFAQFPTQDELRTSVQPERASLAISHAAFPQRTESVHPSVKLELPLAPVARTIPAPIAVKSYTRSAANKKPGFLEKSREEVAVLQEAKLSSPPAAIRTESPRAFRVAAMTTAGPSVQRVGLLQKKHKDTEKKVTLSEHVNRTSALPSSVTTKKSAESEMEAFIHEVSNFVEKPLTGDVSRSVQTPAKQNTASSMALSSDLASLIGLSQDSNAQPISLLQVARDSPAEVNSRAKLAASALVADFGPCRLATVVEQQSVRASVQMLDTLKKQLEAQRPRLECAEDTEAAGKRDLLQLAQKGTQLLEAESSTLLALLADLHAFQASSAQTRAEFVGFLQQSLGKTYEAASAELVATTHSAALRELQAAALSEQLRADAAKARTLATVLVQEDADLARLHDKLDQKLTAKKGQLQEARTVLARSTEEAGVARQAAVRGKGCSAELLAALSEALRLLQGM